MEVIPLATKEIKIKHGDQEIIFKMKELTADEFWSIQDQCIKKTPEGQEDLDTHQLNIQCLARSVVEPSIAVSDIARLPKNVGERLIMEFRLLNGLENTFFRESETSESTKN